MSAPPTTPKIGRASVRKLVFPTDAHEERYRNFIFNMWTEVSYNDGVQDSIVIAQLTDLVFLHQLKTCFSDSSFSRRIYTDDYASAILHAINSRLFALKCNCCECYVRWPNIFNTL